jgi:hypothetical protein
MVYMFLLLPASRFSFLALPLALFLLGHVVVPGDRLAVPAAAGSGRPRLAPRCAVLRKIAMGITMGYMLVLML